MLGERRSNSLFAPAAPAGPERKPEQAEVHDISFEERTGRSLFAENATAPRASELFFAPQEEGVTFAEALSQVQGYLSETYAALITEDNSDAKEQMKRRMARYLQENRIAVDGMTASELVDALYTEMAEYGFLTKYIFADGIEEIDINSWRDIEIQYSDGHTAKLEEHFDSPEHAANVIRRMLQNSGKVLDNASPIITSRLAKNIRISVIKTPVLDEDAGVAASIRIVNPRNLSKADFVQSGTATEEMLDFLAACLRYGVSICVAGATSSGKTTVAGWLLSTIPERKRIFTIEDGSRELQLIRERDGRVTNSVVHTQTRDSENERQRIDQIALLDIALRFNPDIICVGEMRGPEANAAQEAARVGIAVLTTIHSNSSEGTYRRMVSLCKRAVDTPDDTLMGYVTEAYPIVVYCRQLENKQRRITNISECEILPDGSRRLHKLYEYHITDNHLEGDRFIIEGEHRKCEEISESLRRRFIENGMPHGDPEANAAQEAARVGIAVLTTIHSNSSEGTYRRMVSLCKRAVDTPDDTLMGYVTEAYPIVVYCRQLENKQRRITNISECEILPDGSRRLHKLYEYHITDNHLEGDRFIIEGEHRKCEEISESLRRRFIENGMPHGELAQFIQGKEENE